MVVVALLVVILFVAGVPLVLIFGQNVGGAVTVGPELAVPAIVVLVFLFILFVFSR
jgi:hypothetical protein